VAGGQERVLRRRIRTVQATKKITRAMELIAASQIVRSQQRITANRPYRDGMARIVLEAARADPATAARLLGAPEEPSTVAIVVVAGDRGLSGAYNSSVLRATERLAASFGERQVQVRLIAVGRKAHAYFRFRNREIEQEFTGMADRPTFADARRVAAVVVAPFAAGEVDEVLIVSTRYQSAGSQSVQVEQLLPLPDPTAGGGESAEGAGGSPPPTAPADRGGYTEVEPDAEQLLAELAPKAVESEIFSALLEASASEHTARQRAMAAASDNADELIRTLTRVMNRARQDAITTEIMEIVGGAEALRSSKGA
jgi:F-type H+-transporting ATPase subunit gamma